jgi:hypothetical protein
MQDFPILEEVSQFAPFQQVFEPPGTAELPLVQGEGLIEEDPGASERLPDTGYEGSVEVAKDEDRAIVVFRAED